MKIQRKLKGDLIPYTNKLIIMRNLIIGLLLSVCVGCKTGTEEEQKSSNATIHEAVENHESSDTLTLNNGRKWKVVEHMSVYIRNMEKAVEDFETSPNKDYKELAKIIDKNIRDLTSNCTMEGKAHDALHVWLIPFVRLSEKFDVATDSTEQEKIFQEFKTSFKKYNTYFE
jgi:hypothetical protein